MAWIFNTSSSGSCEVLILTLLWENSLSSSIHFSYHTLWKRWLVSGLMQYPCLFSNFNFHLFVGSEEERLALETAVMYGVKKQTIQDTTYQPQEDVDMEFQVQKAVLGSDFKVTISFRNRSHNHYTVTTYLSGNIVFYTGVTKNEFKKHSFSAKLEPSSCKTYAVVFKSARFFLQV